MTFDILWAPEARRDLGALPIETQRRVIVKARAAATDPIRYFKRLKGEDVWSLRVGDHRMLAFLDLRARSIEIVAIGHRRNVYD